MGVYKAGLELIRRAGNLATPLSWTIVMIGNLKTVLYIDSISIYLFIDSASSLVGTRST